MKAATARRDSIKFLEECIGLEQETRDTLLLKTPQRADHKKVLYPSSSKRNLMKLCGTFFTTTLVIDFQKKKWSTRLSPFSMYFVSNIVLCVLYGSGCKLINHEKRIKEVLHTFGMLLWGAVLWRKAAFLAASQGTLYLPNSITLCGDWSTGYRHFTKLEIFRVTRASLHALVLSTHSLTGALGASLSL